MKIDLVITELFPGGAERCLTELALGLAENGDHVRICSIASLPRGEQRLLVDKMEAAGIDVRSCDANHAAQFAGAYRKLSAWMRESDADICQTFLFHANVLGIAAAQRAGCEVRVGGLRVAQASRVRGCIERWAARRMSSLVCVSRAVQSFAATHLNCPSSRSVVIPNGVEVSRWAGAKPLDWSELGWPHDIDVIMFVGRLHPQKGIEQLQRHIDRLVPLHSPRRLLLVGDGPLQEKIETWIDGLGDDRVKRLPWQSDVAPLMRAARVLVLPSRYEGMPNVVLEAMAAGRPVVCSRVEGIEELLPMKTSSTSGESPGVLQTYRVGEEARMLNLIDSFCEDAPRGDEIGDANQSRVRNHFSIPAMIDAYRNHYRRLLADRCEVR